MIKNRPDFSEYLAHFTTDRSPNGGDGNAEPVKSYAKKSAKERLISILNTLCINASKMPWTDCLAVCFTECPWSSLLDHAKTYSSFGVGFEKPKIFAAGGGPVYYVRADHYTKQQWDPDLRTFVTPFWPIYRSAKLKYKTPLKERIVDYSHEREWRVPCDFKFELAQVKFVILPNYDEMAIFPKELKDAIGRDKFLLMEGYKTIERLWPVHNIARP